MTPLERDIEKVKNKIKESEEKVRTINRLGPLGAASCGIVLIFFSLVMGFEVRFFSAGLLIILLAVIWGHLKSREVRALNEAIFHNKMRLYTLKKKL